MCKERSRAGSSALFALKEISCAPFPRSCFWEFLLLVSCNQSQTQEANQSKIKVQSDEQVQLHQLDAFNLAIGLKRAIYDAGYAASGLRMPGFVGILTEPRRCGLAHCDYDKGQAARLGDLCRTRRQRTGPRLQRCGPTGLPDCEIKERPKGSFTFSAKSNASILAQKEKRSFSSDYTDGFPYIHRLGSVASR